MRYFLTALFIIAAASMDFSTDTMPNLPPDVQAKIEAIKNAVKRGETPTETPAPRALREEVKTGQDRPRGQLNDLPLTLAAPARVVTGPATLYMDWNDASIVVNHPVSDQPIEAPALADEFFEALKVSLEIKANSKDTQDLLMLILTKVRLNNIKLEVQDNDAK